MSGDGIVYAYDICMELVKLHKKQVAQKALKKT